MFILATIGCAKEAESLYQSDKELIKNFEYSYAPSSRIAYGNFKVTDGTMVFDSKEDLVKTLQALANNLEYDITSYQDKLDENLTNEEIIALLDAENWDENQTFIDFERENNFSSLRPIYEEKSRLYGEGGLIESDPNNPANCLPFESLPVLTVLNKDAILGIEGKLYKFLNNGLVYEITDGNANTAALISEMHNDGSFKSKNVSILNAEVLSSNKANATCYTNAPVKNVLLPRRTSYKTEIIVNLSGVGSLFSIAESKMINWKKIGSTYKKRKINMTTGITNQDPYACSLYGVLHSGNNAIKFVKSRVYSNFTLNAPGFKVATGKVWATNSLYSGGQNYYPILLK